MLNSMLSDRAARIMLLIVTALALGLALFFAKPVLAPVIFAVVVGIVVSPLANPLQGINSTLIWGLAAMLLNFILYLGLLMMITGLTFVGMTQLGGAAALMPPALFLALNLIEAQFVTPAFVGHQLHLSPLVVFLAIVFGL
ncbi:hypothetical protein MACH17_07890 [Phaeobacter inhibens]|uniref:hypothetical protein n=1 Tax=Phaeobacter inhibens TaxID=221822 RepID=UPI0027782B8F|nr:hypothetical protein [Phaeobacter inhibens]GLO69272.1 hypothetical protein MACH17_07890 [Phaeobacter inhibens]